MLNQLTYAVLTVVRGLLHGVSIVSSEIVQLATTERHRTAIRMDHEWDLEQFEMAGEKDEAFAIPEGEDEVVEQLYPKSDKKLN
jgi:hypothetical protein